MPQLPLGFDKGLVTSRDPLRLQVGELTICRGAVYRPDDPDRLWKLPGRMSRGPFRQLTEGDLIGIAYNAYESGLKTLFGAVGTNLYHTDPSTSPYVWSQASVSKVRTEGSSVATMVALGGPNYGTAVAWFEVEMVTGSSYTWKSNLYWNGSSYNYGFDNNPPAYTSPTTPIASTDPILLNDGVYVQFSATSGYTPGTKFTFYGYGPNQWVIGPNSTYLKALNDGYGRVVLLSGTTDLPKLIDSDGNIRRYGLQPCQVVLKFDSFVDTYVSPTRPTSHSATGADTQFSDPTYAYDALKDSRAYARMTDTSNRGLTRYGNIFSFAGGSSAAGRVLFIDLRMNVNLSEDGKNRHAVYPTEKGYVAGRPPNSYVLSMIKPYVSVEVSTDAGATWSLVFEYKDTYDRGVVQYQIPAGITFANIQVRIRTTREQVGYLTTKSSVVDTRIYDIYIANTIRALPINQDWLDEYDENGNGGTAPVDGIADSGGILGGASAMGTLARFQYTITEVYKMPMSDGSIMEVESLPAEKPLVVDFPSGTGSGSTAVYAVRLKAVPFETQFANNFPQGYAGGNLYYRIYRTAVSGVYPNMGQVGPDIKVDFLTESLTNDSVLFQDDFTSKTGSAEPDTLTAFPLPTYTIFGQTKLLCNPPVPLLDACLFRGAIVGVPIDSPHCIIWSIPGLPEYYPEDHVIQPSPTEGGDRITAIATTGESILVFFRRRVMRIRELFFVSDDPINLNQAQITTLSPSEGLAGGPKSVAQFTTQFGRSVVAWVSDSGIWYTDAAQVYERGVGVHKMSVNLDWENTVDVTRLDDTALTYDPVTQTLWFDYYDTQGARKALAFHVSQAHWTDARQSGEQMVPKITGPHDLHILTRTTGELNGELIHWSAAAGVDTYNVFTEGGTTDEAYFHSPQGDTETFIQTGWMYLGGPSGKFTAFKGNLFHTDWGQNNLDILAEFREDKRGVIQRISKSAVSLLGSRITRFWLGKAGHSLRLSLRHVGRVIGALGPIVLTLEGTEED
jgi:hypothetical protein